MENSLLHMISLTKFDGDSFEVNVFHIFKLEGKHETRIVFFNGQTQMVKESKEEISKKIKKFYGEIFSGLLPDIESYNKGPEV